MSETNSKYNFSRPKELAIHLRKKIQRVRDFLSPNAIRVETNLSSQEEILESAKRIKLEGAECDEETIAEVLSIYSNTIDWVLKKYNYNNRPKMTVIKSIKRLPSPILYSIPHGEFF